MNSEKKPGSKPGPSKLEDTKTIADQPKSAITVESEVPHPAYNRGRPLVIALEYVAWHMPMIREFKSLARYESAKPATVEYSQTASLPTPAEIYACSEADEIRRQNRWDQIKNNPSLEDTVHLYLDWPIYGNLVALENFLKALKAFHQIFQDSSGNKLAANNLAAIHTIWACNLFWEKGHDEGNLTAPLIRASAIELWEETESLIPGQKIFPSKKRKIHWPRLFDNLGINLKFPRLTWRRKGAVTQ